METASELKARILEMTRQYSALVHGAQRPGEERTEPFQPGTGTVPYAGRVFDGDEVAAAVGSVLDFWLTLGPEGEAFEKELAGILGVKHCLLVNSGSSANLLAVSALTSHKLPAAKRVLPGDEIITVAAGFPTTVTPILQCGAVPVFIDNDPETGNARVEQLEEAFRPGKTKAVMMAHTLGNPFNLAAVLAFCKKHDLWLIEDNCDALGTTYTLPVVEAEALGLDHLLELAKKGAGEYPKIKNGFLTARTGSFGDLSTQSFYPPHHITLGEGGAVSIIRRPQLKTLVESFRDWGRDCWCPSGKDNTCGRRFGWNLGELPEGYDHKYIYSHPGYNLKPLDPQAAIGRQQLKKLDRFVAARRANWDRLRAGLSGLERVVAFMRPTHATAGAGWDGSGRRSEPSWFGFMMMVRHDAGFTARDLAAHLEEKKIGNRMLFGGNLLRQPLFVQIRKERPEAVRVRGVEGRSLDSATVAELLPGADAIMSGALFLGTYPGLDAGQIDYMIASVREFVRKKRPDLGV
jgi:CDP-6-deoxy-D-xylo-4-hexulose-3-dehydrase